MAKFCPECGGPLVNETSKFCDKCGAKTGEGNADRQNRVIDSPQKNYSINYILILLFILFFIFAFINGIICLLIVIISTIAVYYDAKAIGAGTHSNKETMETITWSPLSWALIVLLLWIIGLPLYLIKRKVVFLAS